MAGSVVQQIGFSDDLERQRHARGLASLTEGEVRFGTHDRMLYATDASIYQVEPLGVVIPRSIAEIPGLVRYCAEHGLPILPRGGGTSLAGQCVNRAVVIDTSAWCAAIKEVNPESRRCRVEPGITIDDLNDRLRADGYPLFFAPDPATARQCTIGGAIGNNAAGTRSILYGRTAENLLGIDVVLADGTRSRFGEGADLRSDAAHARLARGVVGICTRHERLIRERFPRTVRRNAGYALDMMLADIDEAARSGRTPLETLNLAHLICGSEGTLAMVTGAALQLHPVPKAKGLAVIGFASLDEAIGAVEPMLALGPSAVELLDDLVVGLARANTEYRKYAELMPQPRSGTLEAVLYVEFFSIEGADEIAAKMQAVRAIVERNHPLAGFAPLTSASEMAQALKLRKAGEPLLHGIPGKRKPLGFVEDNAVPVPRLAEFVTRFRAILEREGTRGAFWAHASVGVLHVRPLLDPKDAEDRARMERIAIEAADLVKSLGGVMSGEHGDGRVRGPLLERYFGPELMGAFREVKALFDPKNLLNPGNIVEPGPIASIHETLRVRPSGANVRFPEVDTFFDYAEDDGFDHAVELCNGSGVCRKKQGGTMCPSYMATLDERHSTRGRGNALRLAITGQLIDTPHPAEDGHPLPQGERGQERSGNTAGAVWNDAETLETLRLCLSCKACKTECPSNVDIAKYKAEYLAQGYRATGTPLSARAFGHVRALNKLGSMFAPVSNWVAESPPARLLSNRLLGLSPKRALPAFARSLFITARREHRSLKAGFGGTPHTPTVVLFGDCFTAYNEPGIGLAAIKVLRACGYRIRIADAGCCGRAAISTGILSDAAQMIASTAERLAQIVEQEKAVAIVVAEPSCLSAIKDEWRTLKHGAPRAVADTLAAMSWLVEDFIDLRWDAHPLRPVFRAPGGGESEIIVHGHCHQKALWGAETSARLLRRIAGAKVRVLDSGCCGMAGSFGYTADRYDLSMKIGELVVFPAARAMGEADLLAAPGTSCRHQVKDGTGRRALHPIEIAAAALRDG